MSNGKRPVITDLDLLAQMCAERGVILSGDHIVYTKKPDGWHHGPGYFNKDGAFSYPEILTGVAREIAKRFAGDGIEVVVGPTMGAVSLAAVVGTDLHHHFGVPVRWGYAEKLGENGEMVIKRGAPAFINGARVLIVEDVFTSGGSAARTIEAVRNVGGDVVGVSVVCNRGGVTKEDLEVPRLESLFTIPMEMHPEDDCPLCRARQPINMQVGHGASFYERHPDSDVPQGKIA